MTQWSWYISEKRLCYYLGTVYTTNQVIRGLLTEIINSPRSSLLSCISFRAESCLVESPAPPGLFAINKLCSVQTARQSWPAAISWCINTNHTPASLKSPQYRLDSAGLLAPESFASLFIFPLSWFSNLFSLIILIEVFKYRLCYGGK